MKKLSGHLHSKRLLALATLLLFSVTGGGAYILSGSKDSGDVHSLSKDLSLNGIWKINYTDDPKFASIDLDDSKWCETAVPHPSAGTPKISPECPEYRVAAATKMQGSTYWYRKTFLIDDHHWKEPSFFFGAIKHSSQVYLNGRLIHSSTSKVGDGLTYFPVDGSWLNTGRNTIAVRVTSGETKYPGIFHLHRRGVALGELSLVQESFDQIISTKYVWPTVNAFIQIAALLLVIAMLILGKKFSLELTWLSLFFAMAAGSSILNTNAPTETNRFLISTLLNTLGIAVAGFSCSRHLKPGKLRSHACTVLTAMLLVIPSIYFYAHLNNSLFSAKLDNLRVATAVFPLIVLIFLTFDEKFSVFFPRHFYANNNSPGRGFVTLGVVGTHFVGVFHLIVDASKVPVISDSPIFRACLTVGLLFSLFLQFLKHERDLAFFGRFIRPGLKDLLSKQLNGGRIDQEKFFRPRKIALLKVDIVNHTQTTSGLPYGAKRLYQDIWFSIIDSLLADRIFLDKNVGDGSIYCIREDHPDGACGSALVAANLILKEAIPQFDNEFKSKINRLYDAAPEFRGPMDTFRLKFKSSTGHDFDDLRTAVRIGLVYGFVDEGLWGNREQSHYDVQGDLVSMVARIEAAANPGEIVASKEFISQLSNEGNERFQVRTSRTVHLKGLGPTEVHSFESLKISA